jgi:DNA-binding NtrC family response regulator
MTRRGSAWQKLAPKMERRPAMKPEQICKSALAGVSVLIIEDEKLVAYDVENLLRDFGAAQVWSTGTLSEARKILSGNQDISIVLLDIKLQDGSGEELLAELEEGGIPVIITTGYSAYLSARTPVVHKPYSTERLLSQIMEVLRLAIRQWKSRDLH